MDPSERALLEGVVDAFIEICNTQSVSARTLEPIVAAARHPAAYVRGVGITRLTVLTHYFEDAISALREVASDDDEEVRLYATASLPNTPDAVSLPLLTDALADASWRVRKAAAQAASAFPAPQLVPVLEEAAQHETDARVRIQIELSTQFQRSR
ncbi:MAG: HEAT repeat domain-containing protein [Myxococcales bacterium]|nr:HEAT repeat domain-containing protein [Myxococcales bacterium]